MKKVLLIEDNDLLRQLLQANLSQHGFEVLEASNGIEGLRLAREHLPEIIVSDICMSNGDGYSTLARVRQDPQTAGTIVILITGQSDRSALRRGMEMGADDCLFKPFQVTDLVAAIQGRLRKNQEAQSRTEKQLAALRTHISRSLPHELRTPLAGIMAYAEFLRDQAGSLQPSEIAEMGQDLFLSARRLQRLTDNYSLLARLETWKTNAEELGNLRRNLTFHTRETLERVARQKALEARRPTDLVLELEEGGVAMGQDMFTKVVEELLDNAFKFSKPGAKVWLRTQATAHGLVLEVQDEGRGMKSDQIAMMGPFVQFDRSYWEQQGSGLGLALSKRLTELHGGTFSLHSQIEQGTLVQAQMLPCPLARELSVDPPSHARV